jgi:polyhydroxybutyrate depolymerase
MGAMRRTSVVLVAAAVLLAGCAAPAPDPTADPDARSTITVGGAERTYLFTPPADDGAPLVVMMHGGQDDAVVARRDYRWEDVAAAEGIAVAYPDGIGGSWNAGGCCGDAEADDLDDVGFILALVDELVAQYALDPDRVFLTGFSNGGLLAYRLACESDRFAGIAPVGATLVIECPDPAPIPVLAIHGDADRDVPLDGLIPDGAGIRGIPIAELNAFWREVDGCPEPTVTTEGEVTTTLAECPDGRQVELIMIAGAGHQWPGSLVLRSGVNATSDALDATQRIWDFFASQPPA